MPPAVTNCPCGEILITGLARLQPFVLNVTFTVAPFVSADAVVMVTPATGSLKVSPTPSAASAKVLVFGFMSSSSLLFGFESKPV